MKLDLAGGSYTTRSLAAAAQSCINLYPETIEDPNGSGKSVKVLRQTPGFSSFATPTNGGPVRALWSCESASGTGRAFVIATHWFYEYNSSGSIVSSSDLGGSDIYPAQMFGNGNQLGIVNNGQFYISNGGAPVKARFQLNGTVSIAGTAVTWVAGDLFPVYTPATADPLPTAIYINGSPLAVTFNSSTTATLGVALAGGSGTVELAGSIVFLLSGTVFSSTWVGMPIVIDSITYTVATVPTPYTMTIVEASGIGATLGLAYSVTIGNNTYSTAGGDLVTALTGAYLDGAFHVNRPHGGTPDLGRQVNFSAVNDGTSWSGLDFYSKEGYADYIQSVYADREQIYLFGTETSEVWQNDLATGRPVRLTGAVAKEGSIARFAVVSMQEHVYFLGGPPGGSAVAYRIDGFTPTRISTHAVEEAWALAGITSFAVGWWYLEDGHYFWVLNFLGGPSTWVYDATEKMWHERMTWTGTFLGSYLMSSHAYLPDWGTHLVGGGSKVYRMSSAITTDDGADMKRVRTLPYLYAGGGKRVYCDRLTLEMATGLTTSSQEPTVTLEWSSDNGVTYSTPDAAGFGTTGQTNKRAYWIAQGSFETSAIPRISITGKTDTVLIDVEAEISYGTT